jgi:ribA/ribD-fused uncharacterized protein
MNRKWFSLDNMSNTLKNILSPRFEEFARFFLWPPYPVSDQTVQQQASIDPLSVEELNGEPIYFYKHKGAHGHMSNFYVCNFSDGSDNYMCSEQYLMRKKLDLFDSGNKALAAQIMETRNPMTMQSLGRQVRGFQEEVWSRNRMSVMIAGLRLKYAQNTDVRQSLLATASQRVFEASSKDRVWGIGFSSEQVKNTRPAIPWAEYGLNILGLALQTVRAELLAECLLHPVNDGERVAPNVYMVSQELSDDISELSSVSNIKQSKSGKVSGQRCRLWQWF